MGWLEGIEAAEIAMHYVAPVGEKDDYVSRATRNVTPFGDRFLVHALRVRWWWWF